MTTAMTIKNNTKVTQRLEELPGDSGEPEDILGEPRLLKPLTKAVVERTLDTEFTHQLGYANRNGKSGKRSSPKRGRS